MKWHFAFAAGLFGVMLACGGESGGAITDPGEADAAGGTDAGIDAATLVIDAGDFDQSCTSSEDCVTVYAGSACALCTCPNEAIATKALAAFNAKRDELMSKCGPRPGVGCSAQCASLNALCLAGKCKIAVGGAAPDGG